MTPEDRFNKIEELLRMAAAQTAASAKDLDAWKREMKAERNRDRLERRRDRAEAQADMRELRGLLKTLIRRIAV